MFEEPFTLACLFVAVVVVVVVVVAAVVVAVVAVVADALFKVEVRRFPWSVQPWADHRCPVHGLDLLRQGRYILDLV